MKLLKLLSNTGFISYNKTVAKILGIKEAILLGELCSIADLFGEEEFYFTQEKIANDTALSEYQIREAMKTLIEKGILSVRKAGLPARNFYTINEETLLQVMSKPQTCDENSKPPVPKKLDHWQSKNSSTYISKNTEVRIQSKNTTSSSLDNTKYQEEKINNEEVEEVENNNNLNLGTLQKELYSEISKYNESAEPERKIPVSTSFISFVQKESRELLDLYRKENPSDLLQAFKNYISIAQSKYTWKKIFSWKDFLKNYLDYSPMYFSEKKYFKLGTQNKNTTQNFEYSQEQQNKEAEEKTRKEKLLEDFENLNCVKQEYAEKLYTLFLENGLFDGKFNDFKIEYMSVFDIVKGILSKTLYARVNDYVEKIKNGSVEPLGFADIIKSGLINLELDNA